MKRAILTTALLALVAAHAALAAPPDPPAAVWFYDGFETYTPETRLAYCAPNWTEMTGIITEWGGYWGTGMGTPGVCQFMSSTDTTLYACDGNQYVRMLGFQSNYNVGGCNIGTCPCTSTPGGKAACTRSSIGWAAQSAGNVQILHLKMRRQGYDMVNPWYHAGVYLFDNASPANVIMGWQGGSSWVRPQLSLPTTGTTVTTEGAGYEYLFNGDNTCHVFDAVYDPSTGAVDFYVDGILKWSTTTTTGKASNGVYVRDFVRSACWQEGDAMILDELYVGTSSKPVVTAPVGGTFVTTNTPTITWTNAFGSGMTAYQVRVCSADNAAGPVVYDSGEIAGSAASKQTTALPTCQHLWAFVNEKYAGWTGWSLAGNGGFYCVSSAPPTPTVTSPSGTVVGCKPAVIFTGSCHDKFQVKVTTDSGGSTVVWESGEKLSMKNGASCSVMLTPGTQYYAFAKAGNGLGYSDWSAASPFQVTRTGEGTDIRGMDETWGAQTVYDHCAAAPDDGFCQEMSSGMNWINIKWQVLPDPFNRYADKDGEYPDYQPCDWWPSDCGGYMLRDCPGDWIIPPNPPRTAPSYIYDLWDVGYGLYDCSLKQHKVANLSLDKGVTLLTYASGDCYEGEACGSYDLNSRSVTEQCNIYICDDYGTGKCMASFRYGQGQLGICSDAATWAVGNYTDDDPNRPGSGWHTVRITGRNEIVGDPTTCVWKYYLDEDPTPKLTSTGSIDQSIAPGMGTAQFVDCIAIGIGPGGLVGDWQYDWTAVNTDGDYAPGQWGGPSTEFATISEAVAQGRGQLVTITGETVITAIKLETGSQVGFWVQDVATTDYSNIYIPTTETTNVERGHKVTGVSGLLQWSNATGASLTSAGFAVTTTDADWPPVTMQQKALVAGGYPTEDPEGTLTVGKFAQITGKITDLLYLLDGSYAIYLDDGCGLTDGRSADGGNASAKGVRVIHPEPWSFFGAVGDYYEVRGICVSETAEDRTVRTLLGPTFTEVAAP